MVIYNPINTFTTGPIHVPLDINAVRVDILNVTTHILSIRINAIVCRGGAIITDTTSEIRMVSRSSFVLAITALKVGDLARFTFSGDIRKGAEMLELVVNGTTDLLSPKNEPSMFFRHKDLILAPAGLSISSANVTPVQSDSEEQLIIKAGASG